MPVKTTQPTARHMLHTSEKGHDQKIHASANADNPDFSRILIK